MYKHVCLQKVLLCSNNSNIFTKNLYIYISAYIPFHLEYFITMYEQNWEQLICLANFSVGHFNENDNLSWYGESHYKEHIFVSKLCPSRFHCHTLWFCPQPVVVLCVNTMQIHWQFFNWCHIMGYKWQIIVWLYFVWYYCLEGWQGGYL